MRSRKEKLRGSMLQQAAFSYDRGTKFKVLQCSAGPLCHKVGRNIFKGCDGTIGVCRMIAKGDKSAPDATIGCLS